MDQLISCHHYYTDLLHYIHINISHRIPQINTLNTADIPMQLFNGSNITQEFRNI